VDADPFRQGRLGHLFLVSQLGENPAHSLVSDHGKILRFSPTGPQSNKSSTEIRHFSEKIRQIANIERK